MTSSNRPVSSQGAPKLSRQDILRKKIEHGFAVWARWVFRFRWWVLAAMVALTVVMTGGLPLLQVRMSTDSFLDPNDPARLDYDNYRREFMSDEVMLIVIQSDDLFSREFLEYLRDLHRDLEENFPYLDDIDSLINARMTYGTDEELRVEDLLENWPTTDEELARIRQVALANPLYRNVLLSENGHYTTIRMVLSPGARASEAEAVQGFQGEKSTKHVRILENYELDEAMRAWEKIEARHANPKYPIYLSGGPPFVQRLIQYSVSDLTLFSGLTVLTIGIFLFLIFRRPSGVFLPLLTVLLALADTMGLMGYFNIPISPVTEILPPFLLVAGIGDSVHIMSLLYQGLDSGQSREEALVNAFEHSGIAVVMTSLTTAGGLVSFATSNLLPIQGFGFSAPVGVMLALFYSLVLLPAMIAVLPIQPRVMEESGSSLSARIGSIVVRTGDWCASHPWRVVAVWVVLLVASLWSAVQLRLGHDPVRWFSAKEGVRQAIELCDREMKGSVSIEVILDTGKENGLYEPTVLAKIEKMQNVAESLQIGDVSVGKAISLLAILKETNQALNANDPNFYVLPTDREVIAQELLLFENSGSEDLSQVVDSQFSKARMTLMVPYRDGFMYQKFLDELKARFEAIGGSDFKKTYTGMVMLSSATISVMLESLARSYLSSLLIVTLLMVIFVGKWKLGLFSMVPNVIPIVMSLGMMYAFNFQLDMLMMLVGSVAIGIAVDDTTHFLHHFRACYANHGDSKRAVHETLQICGSALFTTSAVLTCGFFIYMFSRMTHIANFGFITGVTIAVAFLADATLAPAVAVLVTKNRVDLGLDDPE